MKIEVSLPSKQFGASIGSPAIHILSQPYSMFCFYVKSLIIVTFLPKITYLTHSDFLSPLKSRIRKVDINAIPNF